MKHTIKKGDIKGLYIPLITPMLYSQFDKESMRKLIRSVDQYVDGYVPCLSSGEGQFLSDAQWIEVVSFVRTNTEKPLFPGIKRNSMNEIIHLAQQAKMLNCDGITIMIPQKSSDEIAAYFQELSIEVGLPIILYNPETNKDLDITTMKNLDTINEVVSIKDSSLGKEFFTALCDLRLQNELKLTVLQGMEHQLDVPKGCDGYLTSLTNLEPELVRNMLENPSKELNKKILDLFWKYNLGGNWFITLKALLFERRIINSSEEVKLAVKPY